MKKNNHFNLIVAGGALGVLIILAVAATLLKPIFLKQQQENQKAARETAAPTAVFEPKSSTQAIFPGKKVERDPNLSNEQNLVRDYLANNLSELSPTKEELGGKFYLTKIDFTAPGQATIGYEDGHIALTANISYTLSPQELKITDFKIISQ